jgi:hypothetical protein
MTFLEIEYCVFLDDARLLFGYAYPAFECFKSVEKNNVDIEEIRFWCQYW